MDLANLSGGLGADVYVASRLQGAQGGDTALNVAAHDSDRGQAISTWRQQLPGCHCKEGDQAHHSKQGEAGGARAFHALVPARERGPSGEELTVIRENCANI